MELTLVSVNRGIARPIGRRNGGLVMSAIAKSGIAEPIVFVGGQGIAGDVQVDRSVHGGIDKAVLAYSADHWLWWQAEKGFGCSAGCFGENLTVAGGDEGDVAIGDRFRWGDVILEVAQPRGPCANVDMHNSRCDLTHAMTSSGRCGWYLRVIRDGQAPTRGATCVRILASRAPSVRETFFARHDVRIPSSLRRRVQDAPALAETWRRAVANLPPAIK